MIITTHERLVPYPQGYVFHLKSHQLVILRLVAHHEGSLSSQLDPKGIANVALGGWWELREPRGRLKHCEFCLKMGNKKCILIVLMVNTGELCFITLLSNSGWSSNNERLTPSGGHPLINCIIVQNSHDISHICLITFSLTSSFR